MTKKDKILYFLLIALAIIDLASPIMLFDWHTWAPELFSLKRLGLHLLAFTGALAIGTVGIVAVKSMAGVSTFIPQVIAVVSVSGVVGYNAVKVLSNDKVVIKEQRIDKIKCDTGSYTFDANKVGMFVESNSQEGMPYVSTYEAKIKLYIKDTAFYSRYKFYANGEILKKGKDGLPYFIKKPSEFEELEYDNEGKKNVNIDYKAIFDSTTYALKDQFYIYKPVIQVQSGAVSSLYENCGNPLQINVTAFGNKYNPTFEATNAKIINGSQKGEIFVVPTNSENVTISVKNEGFYVGDVIFPVKKIPYAGIKIFAGDSDIEIDLINGIKAPGPRGLQVKCYPLADFSATNPKDARYKLTKFSAYLLRGSRLVKQLDAISEQVDLSSFAAFAAPNDKIIIEIKEVIRTNFLDQLEIVKLNQTIYTIPII